jgi:phage terminase large subunit
LGVNQEREPRALREDEGGRLAYSVSAVLNQVEYEFPEKFGGLFEPHRFKVYYGGRDAAKSWSIARALLLMGAERPMRFGCFREVQNSITDSVYKLLKDQASVLGLGDFYTVLKTEIRGKNGTEFVFSGLSKQTKDSIKSFEGIDIAWVEEGHTISEGSWDILEPTVRKPGSEIIVSFNPEMDTDYVYRKFVHDLKGVLKRPPEALVVNVNWNDNPWRSEVLDAARQQMQSDDPEKYLHVYGGQCRPAVEGAIYYKEVSKLRSEGRLHPVPYDPMLKVHVVCDLGYNDFMSLLLVQKLASEVRVIRYIEDRQRDIPSYSQELKDLKLNYGDIWLPHDARAATLTSVSNPIGATAQEQFRNLGWSTQIVPNIPVEHGIQKTRSIFPRVHIDQGNASELLNRLGRYRRRVNSEGQATLPVHDDESHGSDGFRYLSLVVDQFTNDADDGWGKKLKYDGRGIV